MSDSETDHSTSPSSTSSTPSPSSPHFSHSSHSSHSSCSSSSSSSSRHDLLTTLDTLSHQIHQHASQLQSEIAKLTAQKRSASHRKRLEQEKHATLSKAYNLVNSTELVEIGHQRLSEKARLFGISKVQFSLRAEAPIRYFHLTKNGEDGASSWRERRVVLGERTCEIALVGEKWNTVVGGSITLYGWRKEVEAEEVRRMATEKEVAETQARETEDDERAVGESLKAKRRLLGRLRRARERLERDRTVVDREDGVEEECHNVLEYADSLGLLETKYPRCLLRRSNLFSPSVLSLFTKKRAMLEEQLSTYRNMVEAVQLDVERKTSFLADLEEQQQLRSLQLSLSISLQEAQLAAAKSKATLRKWEDRLAKQEASVAAMEVVSGVMGQEDLSLGVLAVLNKSVEKGEESQRGWERLFRCLREAYVSVTASETAYDNQAWMVFESKIRRESDDDDEDSFGESRLLSFSRGPKIPYRASSLRFEGTRLFT